MGVQVGADTKLWACAATFRCIKGDRMFEWVTRKADSIQRVVLQNPALRRLSTPFN